MSVMWFELPTPEELGEGWSMRALTAARMLECRREGEAQAGEERDKALWANAQLLSQILLKEGEPPFGSGAAVLEHLTAGQIQGLVRRWWERDSVFFAARREEQTDTEESRNESFDMERFLALGGVPPARAGGREERLESWEFPPVWAWPAADLPVEGRRGGGAFDPIRPRRRSDGESGMGEFLWRRGDQGEEGFPTGEHRVVRLPELGTAPAGGAPALTVEELDRAVERDSRRYDGSSPLY